MKQEIEIEIITRSIEKERLAPTQIAQFNNLKKNQGKLLKAQLFLFPQSIKIEEKSQNGKHIIDIIVEGEQKKEENNKIMYENLAYSKQIDKLFINLIIEKYIELLIELKKYGIHLPMLNYKYFAVQNGDEPTQLELSDGNCKNIKKYILCQFGFEYLEKTNQDLIKNGNISPELISDILDGGLKNIAYNEKMTVFAFGCMIHDMLYPNCLYENQDPDCLTSRVFLNDDNTQMQNLDIFNIIKKCIEPIETRPDLDTIKEEHLQILLKHQILNLNGYKIRLLTEKFFKPYEQITGRIAVMEFFTKIKFVLLYFNDQEQVNKYKILLELICQEKDKLKLNDKNQLQNWDQFNTKDEIDEFNLRYRIKYENLLKSIINEIKEKQEIKNIEQDLNKIEKREWKDLEVTIKQAMNKNSDPIKHKNKCLERINTVFMYQTLFDNFEEIQDEIIQQEKSVYDRYDTLIGIIFDKGKSDLHQKIYSQLDKIKLKQQ